MLTALRHLLAILLLPTMVTVVVPRWMLTAFANRDSRWRGDGWSWIAWTLGGLLLLAGLVLVTWCIDLFVRVGKGTLAPWDPTSTLVAVGPYRYTRNPMITGVATILTGEAVLFGSWRLALWALTFIVLNRASSGALAHPTSTTSARCRGGFRACAGAQRRRLNTRTPSATSPMPPSIHAARAARRETRRRTPQPGRRSACPPAQPSPPRPP
jgi:protein-S-isoprenylcysteine O-methyltransferase Ste14